MMEFSDSVTFYADCSLTGLVQQTCIFLDIDSLEKYCYLYFEKLFFLAGLKANSSLAEETCLRFILAFWLPSVAFVYKIWGKWAEKSKKILKIRKKIDFKNLPHELKITHKKFHDSRSNRLACMRANRQTNFVSYIDVHVKTFRCHQNIVIWANFIFPLWEHCSP